jgi:deoxyribonuclease V
MRPPDLHPWHLSPDEACALQEGLRPRVVIRPLPEGLRLIAGTGCVSPNRRSVVAAVVVLSLPDLETVGEAHARAEASFPYLPGLLAFREAPALIRALDSLPLWPDVLLCHAHGLAHPRRFGLACHLGVLLDMPAVGCAKSLLVGSHEPLPLARGARADVVDAGEVVGSAFRTRSGVAPVYVSVGHRADLLTAGRLVLDCSPTFRIPEPLRRAHQLAARISAEG